MCFHLCREGKRCSDRLEARWTNPYEQVYSYCLAKINQSINATQPHISFTFQTACSECLQTLCDFLGTQKSTKILTDCQGSM